MAVKVWATESTRLRLAPSASARGVAVAVACFPLGGFSGLGLCVKYTHRGGQLQSKLFAQGVARRGFCNLLDFVIVIVIAIIIIINSSCSPVTVVVLCGCPRNLIEKEAHSHTHTNTPVEKGLI